MLDKILSTVVDAYYPDRIRAPSGARARAQAAQSIAAIASGAVVATLTIATLQDRVLITRAFATVAVAIWFIAAAAYVWAIAIPAPASGQLTEVDDGGSLIREVLRRAEQESRFVDRRQRYANSAAAVAVLVTVTTIALALFAGTESELARGVVVVRQQERALVLNICPKHTSALSGLIDMATLKSSFVTIIVPAASCGTRTSITFYIPRASIKLLAAQQ